MHALLPAPGDIVWIRQKRWRVRRASRHRGVVRLDVSARHDRLTFLAPFDRPSPVAPVERRRKVRRQSAMARLAHLVAQCHDVRTLHSLVTANVTLLPHQLEPALAVVEGARRVLIADEVGLGKTIQAGIVIAEWLRRLSAARILVLVPAALVAQWVEELAHRFGISARIADVGRLEHATRAGGRGDNPWRRSGVWIASLDYVKQPHVLAGLPPRPWDLVVFDEAHTACGESERHAAADGIARRARHVLLLTATPHDGDEERFARLTALGALPHDPLTVFRRSRMDVTIAGSRRVRWHTVRLSAEERRVLDVLAEFEHTVLAAAGHEQREAALLLLGVFRKRAVSTMSALAISLERRQQWLERSREDAAPVWHQPSLCFSGGETSDDLGVEESASLVADIGLDGRQERAWLRRLRGLVQVARRHEHKLARLAALLRRSREPVIVFTEFRHSLDAARRAIEATRSVAVLHGGQTGAERTQQLRLFLDRSVSVLLATDVASLGLNLQHRSRWAISLELPWNPARIEQRLGRIDRIGQTRPVHFTLLVADHDAERAVLSRVARRVLLARRALGDDVLRGVQPSDAQFRVAVIAGAPLEAASSGSHAVSLCHRWTRPAIAAARTLERRRRLAECWRAPEPDYGRPRVARVSHWPAMCVFKVPVADGAGTPLEEHVVAVRMPRGAEDGELHPQAIDTARDIATRRIAPRAARVARWLQRRHLEAVARERAIASAIDATVRPGEVQPGLFDRRALRAFEMGRDVIAGIRSDERAWLVESDRATTAGVGRAQLVLVLAPS